LSPDPSAQPRFYGPAGHYYTAFYAALAVGFSVATARSIAFYTQLPDLVSELDAKVAGVDWVHQYAAVYGQSSVVVNRKHTAEDMVRELKLCAMRMDHDKQIQVGLHSLTGGNSDDETKNRIKNLKDCKSAGNMPD